MPFFLPAGCNEWRGQTAALALSGIVRTNLAGLRPATEKLLTPHRSLARDAQNTLKLSASGR